MNNYTFIHEPSDYVYRDLLCCALAFCTHGLLIVQEGVELEEGGLRIIERLAPLSLGVERVTEWPGTRLLMGYGAAAHRFRYTSAPMDVLLAFSSRLYDWLNPALPQDLCLLRETGDEWLVTIAHEHDGYLVLDEAERSSIVSKWPSVARLLKRD